jgi:alpha-D-ribose 1-methylphosphonate 5-triphosphate diphosphatase
MTRHPEPPGGGAPGGRAAVGWTAGTVVAADRVLRPGTVYAGADGRIAEVTAGAAAGAHDFGPEALLVPGAVDLHGDAIEKLAEPRPGVRMPFGVAVRALDRRLAAAGVTTAYSALSLAGDELGLRERGATEALGRALRNLAGPLVEHRVHLRVEVTDAGSVQAAEEILAAGEADMVSVMNHTPGQGQFATVDAYSSFHQTNYGVADEALQVRLANKLAAAPELGRRMNAVAAAAHRHRIPLAWHDPDSPKAISRAAALGAVIAEFPTTLPAAVAAGSAGLAVGMGAPNLLRRNSASGNLSAVDAFAAGTVDFLVSDYYPEALWPAVLLDELPLLEAVRLVATHPARAAGLADRGELAPGQRADVVALRPDGTVIAVMLAGRRTQ